MFEKLSKTNPKLMIGFLSMGMYFSWILFLPFFGPALEGKAITKQQLVIMFMITHIIGILHSAWIYNRSGWYLQWNSLYFQVMFVGIYIIG